MDRKNLESCDLSFTKGTVYKDLRKLGSNAYRDIKISLSLGTSSDLVHYLKKHSKLLKKFDGNEIVAQLAKGTFSYVYIVKDHDGTELVVKRSHDGWIPIQMKEDLFISVPRELIRMGFADFDITKKSLIRDVYDYEKILIPFWGAKRKKLEGRKFMPYLNMALHMTDQFLPNFTTTNLYEKSFWKRLIEKKKHKNLFKLQEYLRKLKTPELLIPKEERYIFYDAFTNSLQTLFIQEAVKGREDVVPGKKMAFPFEVMAEGGIPDEMPKLMIEHILRTIECFVAQLNNSRYEMKKIPDFRPLDGWKVFPPTAQEIYFAETSNLVARISDNSKLDIKLVDTHILHEPEGDLMYRWTERRCWTSLFLNLRFWIRKAIDAID